METYQLQMGMFNSYKILSKLNSALAPVAFNGKNSSRQLVEPKSILFKPQKSPKYMMEKYEWILVVNCSKYHFYILLSTKNLYPLCRYKWQKLERVTCHRAQSNVNMKLARESHGQSGMTEMIFSHGFHGAWKDPTDSENRFHHRSF